MYRVGLVSITIAALMVALRASGREDTAAAAAPAVPVLVELFTSEGCSSCPPADALLQTLDRQPFPGGQIIVLSEHVDYWNHIGWTDPYSSHAYSERQSAYGRRFHLDSVYTPQMIVDGSDEFVGNDAAAARKAFDKAIRREKIPLRLSGVTVEGHIVRAHVEGDALDAARHADAFLIVALDHAASEVSRGENAGRQLTHVAVVRSLTKIGSVGQGQALSQDISLRLDPSTAESNLRVIAFLQEPGQARILGATEVKYPK